MNGEDLSGLDLVALYDRLIRPDPPEAISMWPQTAGWIWLGLALAALLAAAAWAWIRRHRANAYRRAALKALEAAGDDPARIAEVLRRTALQAYPRETVAGIHGASWLAFLDQATGRTDFAGSEAGRVLVTAPYRPQAPDKDLPALAARWIRTHRGAERA